MKKTAIVVPCYNEAGRLNIGEFLCFSQKNPHVHFIFVNDGSTDSTQELIDRMCLNNPNQIRSCCLKKNSGKAAAVRKGFLWAMEEDFERIGHWDADLSTPLDAIGTLSRLLDTPGIAIAMGSRVKLLGRTIERRIHRHYLGRMFATVASMLLMLPVYDTQCGAKIFLHTPELRRAFSCPFRVKWIFDVELLARFKLIGEISGTAALSETVMEYPLDRWRHVPGSKIRCRDVFVVAAELLTLFLLLHGPILSRHYRRLFQENLPCHAGM